MNRSEFLDILDHSLSDFEIGRLSRQFGIDYYNLPGATKRDRLQTFLDLINEQSRVEGLAEAAVALRPDIAEAVAQVFKEDDAELAWLDQIDKGAVRTTEPGVIWQWTTGDPLSAPEWTDSLPESLPTSGGINLPGAAVEEAATLHFIRRAAEDSLPADKPADHNPYTPGRAVTVDAMFFGRTAELDLLRAHLLDGANVAITGPRLSGGSSLLRTLARHIGDDTTQRLLPAYLDMKEPANQTVAGLLNHAWTQWWQAVRPGLAVPVPTLAEFVTAVRKLHAAGFRPLLLLDEFEQLLWRGRVFDDHLLDAWLELGREGLLRFALTSHAPVADLPAQHGFQSRVYELFRPLDLGLLDEVAARALLSVPIERQKMALPAGAVDHLLALAGPQPFFLQLAGFFLFDSLDRHEYTRDYVTRRFTVAATPYWAELWASLTPLARDHFPLGQTPVATSNTTLGNETLIAARQQRILCRRGLVIEDQGGYRPFSLGFAGYVRRLKVAKETAEALAAALNPA